MRRCETGRQDKSQGNSQYGARYASIQYIGAFCAHTAGCTHDLPPNHQS
ncbi:hypothetical protein JL2886_03966 [Phaeobacter gallaeciensis]|uniref:Uncharacterized protein n=1 Tax=Phaeobacter gallaeciensis TaxID=60890 RepID=A0A1B0ZXK2_9RHOB|nr:hypothetical protein JL2886_03966 [Phaeobacter gallaeciensis]